MRFVKVTEKNWESAVLLSPKEEQKDIMRTDVMMHSLAKCFVYPGKYLPYIIEEHGEFVGGFRFRNYIRGVNLVSFFIDSRHQGKGLGRKAMETFISWTEKNFIRATEIEIWVVPENTVARKLYESLGFRYTGEVNRYGCLYMELQL